jgi:hypothetical protein
MAAHGPCQRKRGFNTVVEGIGGIGRAQNRTHRASPGSAEHTNTPDPDRDPMIHINSADEVAGLARRAPTAMPPRQENRERTW